MTKAQEAKAKAAAKRKAEEEDEDEDAYTALSKSTYGRNAMASSSKPPPGSFDTCAKCGKPFTVVRQLVTFHRILGSRSLLRLNIPWLQTLGQGTFATHARKLLGQTLSRNPLLPRSAKLRAKNARSSTMMLRHFAVLYHFASTYVFHFIYIQDHQCEGNYCR